MSRFSNDPLLLREVAAEHVSQIAANSKLNLATSTHPLYDKMISRWERWRYAYRADDDFKALYLRKFSQRESDADFSRRSDITYVTPQAQVAVNEVKDSIFQRLVNVEREGGPTDFLPCVGGSLGGVDMTGSTMNGFIGNEVLPELLAIGKVAIYVDRAPTAGLTLADERNTHPYIYIFRAEDVRNWVWQSTGDTIQLKSVLLREVIHQSDPLTGLPQGFRDQFRYMWLLDGKVAVQRFDWDGKPIESPLILDIPEIPLVFLELQPNSLMSNVADYQIALMNLESSDLSLALKSNIPLYTEQYNPAMESGFLRPPGNEKITANAITQAGEVRDARAAKPPEVEFGVGAARRYPQGLERPAFINPSAEPLRASMEKGDQIKADIRLNVKLAVQNLAPRRASADSKAMDDRTLEAGLSAIGLILEQAERRVAKFWAAYSGDNNEATIRYPSRYDLKSDIDRNTEAEQLTSSISIVPSPTYKREAVKRVVSNRIGTKVSTETLNTIFAEIDQADIFVSSTDELKQDIELGLLSLDTASASKGYPEGEVEQAAADHADRVARIVQSQASARGASDMGGLGGAAVAEKTASLGDSQ